MRVSFNNSRRLQCLRILTRFTTLSLLLLALAAFANLVIDPFDLFGVIVCKPLNGRKINLPQYSPLVKSAGIIRYKPDTLILGSSVVDGGFAVPGSTMQYYDEKYDANNMRMNQAIACCLPVYNAAVRGGGVYEAEQMLRQGIANNPRMKRAVLGIEWGLFTSAKPLLPKEEAPLLGYDHYPISFIVGHLLSWDALREAGATFYASDFMHGLRQGLKDRRRHAVDGLRRAGQLASLDAAADTLPLPHEIPAIPNEPVVTLQPPEDTKAFLFSMVFTGDLKRRVSINGRQEAFLPERLAYVRRMRDLADTHHIAFDVFVNPQPALLWAAARQAGVMPEFDAYLRGLAAVTPFWDFSNAIDFTDRDYFLRDALHYSYDAGRFMLPLLFSERETPEVTLVMPANVDAVIARRHALLDAWLAHHPYDQRLFALLGAMPPVGADLPSLYEPLYKGHRILQLFGRFYALPPQSAAYDVVAVLSGDMPSTRATTLEALLQAVDRQFEEKAERPVMARPRMSACTSCVPS